MITTRRMLPPSFLLALALLGAGAICGAPGSASRPQTVLLRTPNGGIQPQTALDSNGGLHMIYFSGDASAGNIFYVVRANGAQDFSRPIQVNSQDGSALAVGTVRGPQMAMSPDGGVYVVWFGSKDAQPRGPGGATPILFSRLNDAGTGFEPQRCLMQYAKGVDGGLSVAAGADGYVYVVWHAQGSEPDEAHRKVYLARSTDHGKTFAREAPISPPGLGACGCCGMRAMVSEHGRVHVFFRAAAENVNRDMTMLVSSDCGVTFRSFRLGPWKLNACPMSSASLYAFGDRMAAAWETEGQIHFDEFGAWERDRRHEDHPAGVAEPASPPIVTPPGSTEKRKQPAIAVNGQGWVLLSWTEGTGWKKGGSLAWQLYDQAMKPVGGEGHAAGVPVWGLPSAFADRRGNFTIVY